jgi:hypothetical protein
MVQQTEHIGDTNKMINMTPIELANVLVGIFYNIYFTSSDTAKECEVKSKKCALIGIDNILDEISNMPYEKPYLQKREYYLEVKQEIEKL